jgi:hypothetical protein
MRKPEVILGSLNIRPTSLVSIFSYENSNYNGGRYCLLQSFYRNNSDPGKYRNCPGWSHNRHNGGTSPSYSKYLR